MKDQLPYKPRPYKVICISLYKEDLKVMDAKVEALKKQGYGRANRSMLIRYALQLVNPDHVVDLYVAARPMRGAP